MPDLMHLQILLPFAVFADNTGVTSIVAETPDGSFGLLPQRLDCVAALEPGILTYTTEADGEVYIAVDQGILVKTGNEVRVSVRNAQGGVNLDQLYAAVKDEFLNLDEREREVRTALAKLESGFVRRFAGLQQP
ncbi:F0F1 ATP synthase subunit epsilon [Thiothrix lacustris]|uniref:ATP synthase epsilon chain n=1 Tax=Thiothrix lacustris TaxID=525917 RepID=A0ABY9MMM7_9GAMM|nr:F0F1 ATP synthase subunit epsilon [Thiothrix lacustris]WML89919.1 F0F1 ATP synthase subunit epsilon [Thiothrix lacustris]